MNNRSPNLILGGSSFQTDGLNVKASVTAYSSDIEADIYNSLRYPDVKLTRLENDESCLKYLSNLRKKKHCKSLFYNSDNVSSVESDCSLDDIDSTEFSVSNHETLSCNEFRKNSKTNDDFCEVIETNWNSHKNPLSRFLKSKVTTGAKFFRFPVIKLIRLENDENCCKYLNKTPAVKMHETKVDKQKPSPVLNAPGRIVLGKVRDSSDESKDSCIETSINDSDCSQNSINLETAKTLPNKKSSLSGNTTPSEVDLITLDWPSSDEEDSTSPSLKSKPFDNCDSSCSEGEVNENSNQSEINNAVGNCDTQSSCSEVNENSNQSEINNAVGNCDTQSSCSEVNENSNQSEINTVVENCDNQNSCSEVNQNSNLSESSDEDEVPKCSLSEKGCVERNTVHDSDISVAIDTDNLIIDNQENVRSIVLTDSDHEGLESGECFIIDFEFVSDDVFERLVANSRKSEDSKPIQATCELCNDSFFTRPSLYNHMEQIHNYSNVYECAHCGQIFSVKACLVYHLYAQLGNKSDIFKAHICPQYSCSRDNFTKYELEFLKSLCSNHFILHNQLPQKDDAFNVSENDSNNDNTEEKEHLGEIKVESLSISQSPTESIANKRKIIFEESDGNLKKQKCSTEILGRNTCNDCLVSFKNKRELFNHLISVHNPIYSHECQMCQKLFHDSISFASHLMRKECSNKKTSHVRLNCEICGGCYKTPTILRKHKMNIHNLYSPLLTNDFHQFLTSRNLSNTVFNCIFCYESHSCLSSLRDHEQSVHHYYSCFKPWCSKSFSSKSDLERHLFLHFSQGESSFCGFCSQLFFTKAILEKHIKRHLGDRILNNPTTN